MYGKVRLDRKAHGGVEVIGGVARNLDLPDLHVPIAAAAASKLLAIPPISNHITVQAAIVRINTRRSIRVNRHRRKRELQVF